MRLLICAGGTGGGVYPALTVLQSLILKDEAVKVVSSSILWVGGAGGMESDLVKREGVPFESIPAAGVHGVGGRALPGNLWRLWRGLLASCRILSNFRPDVLLFTGGYVAVPMALAARLPRRGLSRPRSLVFIPDIEPGLALSVLLRMADQVAVTAEVSKKYLPVNKPVKVTGYPVRADILAWNKGSAREFFELSSNLPVLLVSGGSKGARSLNRALLRILPELLSEFQVIHISGQLDWPDVETARRTLTEEQAGRYHAYPYLYKEMGAALTAADLTLTRSGASTLGELPAVGLPAILVPYPYAWRYQKVNAHYLVDRGAAVLLEDADLPGKLLPTLRELMRDPYRLAKMSHAMHDLAQPQAAEAMVDIIRSLAGDRQAKGHKPWLA